MTATMTAAQMAAHQTAHRCDLVFADTCSLLDLIRLPLRTRNVGYLRRELEAGLTVLSAVQSTKPTVVLILAPPVPGEFTDHAAKEGERVAADFEKHREVAVLLNQTQTSLGISAPMAVVQGAALRATAEKLKSLAQDLVDAAIHLHQVPGFGDRAMARVVRRIAPASRGKESKDCLIIEHVLNCRGQCSSGTAVFISSNTRDYCDSKQRLHLRPPLDAEFARVNLAYRVTWQSTLAVLKSPIVAPA